MMARMGISPQTTAFTILLGVLAGLPALSIDLSAPTLVELPAALGTSTTVAGLSLSVFMVGFALGQFAGGRMSDRVGRRPVLLGALAVFTLSGVAAAFATSGAGLVSARLVQGTGAGGCAVLGLAMVQDLFQGEAARSKRSYVTMIVALTPIVAPALGAALSAALGWRSVHAVLALAGLALGAIALFGVRESRPASARRGNGLLSQKRTGLRHDRRFWGLAGVNALSYSTIFAYIAGAPVVIMGELGYKPAVYAGVFACTAFALGAGAWVSARLGRRGHGAAGLLLPGLLLQSAPTLVIALACSFGRVSHPVLMLPLLALSCFGRGIVAPNLAHLALGDRREDAGLASAVLGISQLLAGAGASAIVAGLLPHLGHSAMTTSMALTSGAAAALWLAVRQRRPDPQVVLEPR